MGTRADFYVRKQVDDKSEMEWLGSIAWDGYPDGIDKEVLLSTTEEYYRDKVKAFLVKSEGSLPEEGWPWPWNDSKTTDYSYIFQDGKVSASAWGNPLFDPLNEPEEKDESEGKMDGFFPDMTNVKNVQLGRKSGLIIATGK